MLIFYKSNKKYNLLLIKFRIDLQKKKNYLLFWYWKPHLLSVDRIYVSKLLISLGLPEAVKR